MNLGIYQEIENKRQQILSKWQLVAFSSYANHDAMKEKKESRFSNPIAYVIEKSTGEILDWLIKIENDVDVFTPLKEICKLKAIQDIKPAEALSFIFTLKQIIREEIETKQWAIELWGVDKRIDEIGLLAFDIYSDCRAKIYELRMNEIKRMYGRDAG